MSEIEQRHQHKNTIQALAFSPYLDGNYLAAGSRDQSLSVFDIRAMKELRIYRGHKKEVCCKFVKPFLGYF
jgi:polyadenylation factor subunit 2